MCKLLLALATVLVGTGAIGLLTSCGRQPPTAQTSPTANPTAIASASPSPTPSPTPKSSPSSTPTAFPSPLNLPAERSQEPQVQLALLSLTSGQQAQFKEKKEFARSISDLDKRWQPSDRYEIVMKPEGKEKVVITAKAKDADLKSYTAVVYGFESDNAASAVICGTLSPSQTPPVLTASPPQTPTEPIFCPPGTYRSDGMGNPPMPPKL